ncbi:hypothetical protein K501DRAFT_276215 [Backusella circina FSU 941]|nr:hypothetical protein K501DRAFT_276215 [Backusella circina FSU 941]
MKKNTKSKLAKRRNLSWESRTNTGKMPDYHLSWLERGANNAKVTVFLEGKHIKESGSHECHKYGMTFYSGTKVDQNYGISLLYMRKGAEIYRGQSQAQLALIYLERIGVEKNSETKIDLIKRSINEMSLEDAIYKGGCFIVELD